MPQSDSAELVLDGFCSSWRVGDEDDAAPLLPPLLQPLIGARV